MSAYCSSLFLMILDMGLCCVFITRINWGICSYVEHNVCFTVAWTRHEPILALSVSWSSIPQNYEMNQDLTVSRSQHNQTDKDERRQSSSRFNNHSVETLKISFVWLYKVCSQPELFKSFCDEKSGRSQLEEGPTEAKWINNTVMKQQKCRFWSRCKREIFCWLEKLHISMHE